MAAIDKIYVKTYEQYEQFSDWCWKNFVEDKYGKKVPLRVFLFWNKCSKDAFEGEDIPAFTAPYYVDAYIIRNCPLDFIQEELKFMYQDSYDKIKRGELYNSPFTSETYKVGKHFKCNIPRNYGKWIVWINSPTKYDLWYHKETNTWDFWDDFVDSEWNSSTCFVKSIKALKRNLRKWKLPIGTEVAASNLHGNTYRIYIRK